MRLGKRTGGCTLSRGGKSYAWAKDDSVINVPADFGDELLNIRGADFFRPEDEDAPEVIHEPERVTEPEPAAGAEITEPAPKPRAEVTEGPVKGAKA